MSFYRLEPPYDPDTEDLSEVACCRHCRELIEPGTEVEWNGYDWHRYCAPIHVIEGREQEARDAEAQGK